MNILRGIIIAFLIGVILFSSYIIIVSLSGGQGVYTNSYSKTDNLIKDGRVKINIASGDGENGANNEN